MIKVILVDDHELVREGLKMILKEEVDMQVVAEAKDGVDAFEKLRKNECDVLVLDMNMPGKDGLELIADLKIKYPKLRILILSIHIEDQFALRTLKAGASGYVSKDAALDELVSAIRTIHTRGKYLSNKLAELVAFEIKPETQSLPHEQLSNRELEIMIKIAQGLKIKEISTELSLGVSTINTYRVRIFDKMKLRNNVELTHYAMSHGLIE